MRRSGALLALCCAALLAALAWPLPDEAFEPVGHRRVLDRYGGVLAERTIPDRGREHWVELDEVAPAFLDALVASEDRRFRLHPGVDPLAVMRAARANLKAGRVVQGGSTLTQQTARLLFGRPPGFRGKALEAWQALRLDLRLSKDEILAWYVNRAWFGRGAHGVEAAARAWFDETAASLSVAEAAALVALLPAPDRISPDRAPEEARRRRMLVIDAMVAAGSLDEEAARRAKAEPLQLRRPARNELAPHLAARLFSGGDREIRSTLDPDLQRRVEDRVREELEALAGREVDHAAVLVASIETGEVLAYVGSGDFHAPDGQVDGVRARRSAGSTLKPFVYALAFEQGLLPTSVLADLPRQWSTPHGTWAPENYGERFRGPVRAREALASSLNLPAVAVTEQVGLSVVHDRLRRAGFALSERPAHYGLGLVLGGAEVTLEELVAGFAALARGGWAPLRFRLDDEGVAPEPLLSPEAVWLVTDILSDPVARVPGFGRRGPLSRSYPAAVKTGTSSGHRDNWTVGFTPDHVVGVWVGNFDGRPMGDVSGVTGAGPLWARVMDEVTSFARPFPAAPETLERREVCALSGAAPGPGCPHRVQDWLPREHPPLEPCAWHRPDCPVNWPSEYRAWAEDHGLLDDAPCNPGSTPLADGTIGVAWPIDGSRLYVEPHNDPPLFLRAQAPVGSRSARWFVNGAELSAAGRTPLEAAWFPVPGEHLIEVEVDGRRSRPVRVRVLTSGSTPEVR